MLDVMKKFWIQFVTLVIIILGALYLTFDSTSVDEFIASKGLTTSSGTTVTPQSTRHLKVGDVPVSIDLADTADLRSKGLGGRDKLDQNSGMLFVFPETKKYQFYMKGMKFSLDFIWINNGHVVDILKNIPAPIVGQSEQNLPIYEPIVAINQVLEVNAGFIDAHNIKVGDTVEVSP